MELMLPPVQRLADHVYSNCQDFAPYCAVHDKAAGPGICASCHSSSYYGGRPVYECDNFKRAYLWRFLSAHIAQTEQPLSAYVVPQIDKQPEIRALSLGGGPGIGSW